MSSSVVIVAITTSIILLTCEPVVSSATDSVSSCGCNVTNIELNYYWVDYNGGAIPKNALVVDKSPPNGPTYVGKVFTKNFELLPATIRTTKPYATFTAYGQVQYHNEHIMVLCSQFPENFQWVVCPASDNTCNSVQNKVPAGTEVGRELFFGLYYVNGVPFIGKIYRGVAVPYGGEVKEAFENFFVLTYQKPRAADCAQINLVKPN